MPVVASDLIMMASLNMPSGDAATLGGGIDVDNRVTFAQLAANDTIRAVSSSAGDTTQTLTVRGRDISGNAVQEAKVLTGTTPITFNTLGTVERLIFMQLNADAAGTITISTTGGFTIATIPVGERGIMAFLREAAAAAGSTKTYYSKVFIKNNGASTLTGGSVSISDPTGKIAFGLAASLGDTATSANRLTAPGGISFSANASALPASLTAGTAIGVWIRNTHPAGDSSFDTNLTMTISGTP